MALDYLSNALERSGMFLAQQYEAIAPMGPADVAKHVNKFRNNFDSFVQLALMHFDDDGDLLAPEYVQNVREFVSWIPETRTYSFDDYETVLRTVYMSLRQGQTMRNFLMHCKVQDTESPLQPLVFRPGTRDDIGRPKQPGVLPKITADFAPQWTKNQVLTENVDQEAMQKMLRCMDIVVASTPETTEVKSKVVGYFASQTIDYSQAPRKKENEILGGKCLEVDKSVLGVRERSVQLFGWKPEFTRDMCIAIQQNLLRDHEADTFTFDSFKHVVPQTITSLREP